MKVSKPIQQKDLANKLGVSTMTVSKALRDHADISLKMKKRVKSLAEELGYRPNYVARNLSVKKTFTIGIVMPKIAHSFYSLVLDGIYKAAKQNGYQVILTVSRESAQTEEENIQNLLAMRVDGLLVSVSQTTKSPHIYKTVRDLGVPLVFFDRALEGFECSSVSVDDREGAVLAVEHAIKLGYTKIAHFAGYSNVDISKNRCAGYLDALKKHGIPIDDGLIVECGFGEQAGYQGFMQLYKANKLPEVIFTVSDSVAMGVYQAAKETNIKIPGKICVIGFTDIKVASILSPALTTVHEPAEVMGKKAVELLVEEMASSEPIKKRRHIIKTELMVRESCGELLKAKAISQKVIMQTDSKQLKLNKRGQ